MRLRARIHFVPLTWLLAAASWATLASVLPARALAAASYAAKLESSCCNQEVLESGATEKQYIVVTNSGTATWGAPGSANIDVGPEKPGAPKGEFTAASWTTVDNEPRASVGVSHEVPPGSSYRFVFEVKAPTVAQRTTFTEHFGIAADGGDSTTWIKGADVQLEFTVVPASPPTVSLMPSVNSITAGGSFTVSASAGSAASVNRVVISFAGMNVTNTVPRNPEGAADEQTTLNATATFTTAGLGAGQQTVVATAYDDAGLSATSTATIEVQPPLANPLPVGPSVLSSIRMYFAGLTVPEHPNELRLTRLVILDTMAGERVSISCSACGGSSKLGSALAHGGEVTFRPHRLVVGRRSRLLVYVVEAGAYGRYKEYAISVPHVSVLPRAQGCLAPGTRRHVACPG
jgi:hypothetical protein